MASIRSDTDLQRRSYAVARDLTLGGLKPIRFEDTTHSLAVIVAEADQMRRCADGKGLFDMVSNSGTHLPETLTLFGAPDLIWQAISERHPEVGIYPLGEINERAVKSMIGGIVAAHHSVLHDPYATESLVDLLEMELSQAKRDDVVVALLTSWCFNLAITYLRSTQGFLYNFPHGTFQAASEHKLLRGTIYSSCHDIAIHLARLIGSGSNPEVEEALKKVLGLRRVVRSSHRDSKKPYLNVVVGNLAKSKLNRVFNVDSELTRIVLPGHGKGNVKFDYSGIESTIGHRLTALARDLIEIGFAVYMADNLVKRRKALERRISILVPVRHPEKWTAVERRLARVISFLGRDRVDLHFAEHEDDPDGANHELPAQSDEHCCLLSGGLDSAAGAIWALEQSLEPTLVSHAPGKVLPDIQSAVVELIGKETGRSLKRLVVPWGRSAKRKGRYKLGNTPRSPMLQYLRSFFYCCLATGIAVDSGYRRVYVFENGPVAINPVLSEAHVNTKTVHPVFLQEFGYVVQAIFGADIQLENPFLFKTKGEIPGLIQNKAAAVVVLPHTNSCLHYWRVPVEARRLGIEKCTVRQDGVCLPCMLRRVAMKSAGLPEGADYLTDIFDLMGSDMAVLFPERAEEVLTDLGDWLRFCQHIVDSNDGDLLCMFPDLSICADGVDSRELVAMMRRQSEEVLQVFKEETKPSTKELFSTVFR